MRFAAVVIGALAPLGFAPSAAAQALPGPAIVSGPVALRYVDIRKFEPDGDEGIWFMDRRYRWYYSALPAGCPDLRFAYRLGVEANGSDTVDRTGALLVEFDPQARASNSRLRSRFGDDDRAGFSRADGLAASKCQLGEVFRVDRGPTRDDRKARAAARKTASN